MRKLVAVVCLACALIVSKGRAQNYLYATGNPTFSTQIPIENGFINVNNGEIHIEIPLATHPQRGNLQLNERLVYDSRIWKIIYNNGYQFQPTNVPNSMGGWVFSSGTATGTYTYNTQTGTVLCNPQNLNNGYYSYIQYLNWQWTDPQGTTHTFYYPTIQYTGAGQLPCTPQSLPNAEGWASDGSGYYIQITNFQQVVIYDKQGNSYHPSYAGTNPPANTPLIQDSNGNYFSQDASGNLVDTLNRTPVLTTTSGNQIFYDVLGYGGNRSRYTVTTETINYNTAFAQSAVADKSGSFTAIQSIGLPDGSSYSFTYDSGTAAGNYGELTSVTLPTGGVIQYTYRTFQDSFQNRNRWLQTRVKDGGTTTLAPATISNCTSSAGCQEKVTVTSPAINDTVYTFTLDQSSLANAGSWVTTIDAYQGSASTGTKLASAATNYTYQAYSETYYVVINNVKTPETIAYQSPSSVVTTTTLSDVALTKKTEVDLVHMGTYPNAIKEWDYYSGTAPSTPTRETDYTYGYIANSAQLPTQIIVKDGAGNHVSETDYGYDETTGTGHAALQPTSGLLQHNSVSGNRGNVTTVAQWIDSSGAQLSKEGTYDDAGTLLSSTDPNGATTYGHDASDAFTTLVTLPTPSSGVVLAYGNTVDFSTGLSTGQTDPNNTQNVPQGYDAFGRPTGFTVSNGGTTFAKSSLSNTSTQSSDYEYQNASVFADKETLYDGYGRLSRVAVANGQSSNPWYQVDTCYDTSGRISFQSYRYQANGFASGKICSGAGDTYTYDALNRIKTLSHTDGTSVQFTYTGRATKMIDENGVTRISQVDGLGRKMRVCEISSNSTMPGSGSPISCGTDIAGTGFVTTFSYAMPSHTTTVTQGQQTRTFQTDWTGRTVSASEPETGSTTYTYAYNATGLVVTRKKPKANQSSPSTLTTTTSQYDALGRAVNVTYDDGTPTKTFMYDKSAGWTDLTQNYMKGHMSLASVSGASTIFNYDPAGRTTDLDECLPSGCGNVTYNKKLHYAYDWTGNALSSSDAGSATSTYNVSRAGEIVALTSSLNNSSNPPNVLSNVQYGPNGPISYSLGNGLSGVRSYDGMGRTSGGWICRGSTAPYCTGGTQIYGFTSGWAGSRATQECDTVLNQCMNFGYDEFGRLSSRTVTSGTAQNFTYTYDRYGNRWYQTVTAGTGPAPNLSFTSTTNQITQGTCSPVTSTQYCYDAAGNMTADAFHTYSYDAEGNVTQVDAGSTGQYVYNALNERVRAQAFSTIREFVFDTAGQRVSMWNGSVPGQGVQGQYLLGGGPLAYYKPGAGAHYQHQDWLGTERMRTSYNGAIEDSYTSLPFGDAQTTGADNDPYHFAGLDYDSEANADHAQFREYSPTQGRWLGTDPYDGSYDFDNPQSLNRYSYVLNNPLSLSDPRGLDGGGCGVWCYIPIIGPIIMDLFSGSPRPRFHGSLHPRPTVGGPSWDGNFGESLGISTKLPRANLGLAAALGLPDAGCEFGACGPPIGFSMTPGCPACDDPADQNIGLGTVFQVIGGTIAGFTRLAFTGHWDPPSPTCIDEGNVAVAKFDEANKNWQLGVGATGAQSYLLAKRLPGGTTPSAGFGSAYISYKMMSAPRNTMREMAVTDCMKRTGGW